ncbi:MAG: hypothetical protein JWQ09_5853 [Segetibacter sp.]|nr:hypothetical protein [Segetibacter sp.]
MSIFSIIGHFFSDLFNAAQKAWDKLPAPTQTAMLHGSGVFNIINAGINESPQVVVATIEKDFPDLNLTDAYTGLIKVAQGFNLIKTTAPATLEDLISLIQNYLKGLDSGIWPAVINAAANVLTLSLTGGTPFEIIASLGQFVYSNFIKPNAVVLAEVATVASIVNIVAPNSQVATAFNAVDAIIAPPVIDGQAVATGN